MTDGEKRRRNKEYDRLYSCKEVKRRKSLGLCEYCGKKPKELGFRCLDCVKKCKENYRDKIEKGLCTVCGKGPLVSKSRCSKHLKHSVEARRKLKIEVISAYGKECVCCGITEIEFLTIEHSKNNGAQHKRDLKCWGTVFYRWLKKNNFPKDLGLTIMCMNCNFSRGKYGYCPHEKKNTEVVEKENNETLISVNC